MALLNFLHLSFFVAQLSLKTRAAPIHAFDHFLWLAGWKPPPSVTVERFCRASATIVLPAP